MKFSKGQMIKELKQAGIRTAEKEGVGSAIGLEHLKYFQVCQLWLDTFQSKEEQN